MHDRFLNDFLQNIFFFWIIIFSEKQFGPTASNRLRTRMIHEIKRRPYLMFKKKNKYKYVYN